jgi:hypothetical protein
MAVMTKQPGAAGKSSSIGAKKKASAKTASTKPASAKGVSTKTRFTKAGPAKTASPDAAAHILRAAKGPRTVSHRKIKEAVEKVFRDRGQTLA